MVNDEVVGRLKKGVLLVNPPRAAASTISTRFSAASKSGKIGGVALDVSPSK